MSGDGADIEQVSCVAICLALHEYLHRASDLLVVGVLVMAFFRW
jgi:hypothetical protein